MRRLLAAPVRAAFLIFCVGLFACDEDTPPAGAPADLGGDAGDAGGDADAGEDLGGCASSAQCQGRICVEGRCEDCLADEECGAQGDRCLGGVCCQSGEEGCACGAGCGEGLSCVNDRCSPCPSGSLGCACQEGEVCGEGLRCRGGACQECPAGSQGCACDAQGECRDELTCQEGACVLVQPPSCEELGCAQQGRVCVTDPAPACGACDGDNGYIADAGGDACLRVEGDACQRDAECMEGQRCLRLLDNRPAVCTPVPGCVESRPEGAQGAAWSPAAGACVACPSCEGREGTTGAIWPTTTLAGECLCETQEGWYFDIALASNRARPCDADGDGWVQQPAEQFLDAEDPSLSTNARCAVTRVREVVLRNERGELREIPLAELGVQRGELALYEPELLDLQALIEESNEIPVWGEAKPSAAMLNPMRKFCVGSQADFNGNGVSDVREHAGSTPRQSWMRPWVMLAHFGELHRVELQGEALTIAEVARCEAGFPLGYEGEGEQWRECQRRRPSSYRGGRPGYDFGRWSCDATAGSCPEALNAETGLPLRDTCSGDALTRFTGMNHHSQFGCYEFVAEVSEAHQRSLSALTGGVMDANRCSPGPGGAVSCAVAEAGAEGGVASGDVAWGALRAVSAGGDAYTEGCQEECRGLLPECPGYAPDEGNQAGCRSDAADFGALVCTNCPGGGEPCAPSSPGEDFFGVCARGRTDCDGEGEGAQQICAPLLDAEERAARQMLSDPFEDIEDSNCDGFRGSLRDALFVDADAPGGRGNRGDGSATRPYRTLREALAHVSANSGQWRIYVSDAPQRSVEALEIPSAVVEIRGGVAPADDPRCAGQSATTMDWCALPDGARTALEFTSPRGLLVTARPSSLLLSHLDVSVNLAGGVGSPNGASLVGLHVDAPGAQVVLRESAVTTGDAPAGLDGAAYSERAQDGQDGQSGSAGCQVAAGFCGNECPNGYWTSGRGGDCLCDGGSACDGGDGGQGGTTLGGCSGPTENEAAEAGEPGLGGADATAGQGGMPAFTLPTCDVEDDNLPADTEVGGDGMGAQVPLTGAGMGGGGFFSAALGWVGRAGTDGARGSNGAGGGGGAGGVGSGAQALGCPNRGGHGAGGGSGGCGGLGGRGGGAGGGSFAVMVVRGGLILEGAILEAGRGGDGGDGGDGQEGGAGGAGGRLSPEDRSNRGHRFNAALQDDARNGARGGDGGAGAAGAPGGAGVGGPSAALLLGPDVDGEVSLDDGVLRSAGSGEDGQSASINAPMRTFVVVDHVLMAPALRGCELDADCGGGAYCEGGECLPRGGVGRPCAQDNQCQSGYCAGAGACAERADLEQACEVDQDCRSGLCGEQSATCQRPCAIHEDCPNDQRCGFELRSGDGGACVARFDDGLSCADDEECGSGFCSRRGFCVTPCESNSDCGQGRWCDVNVCEDQGATGDTCAVADACLSGACSVGGRCLDCDENSDCVDGDGARTGFCALNVCEPLLEDGDPCVLVGNEGCRSGICDVACTACVRDGDCAGADQFCKVFVGGQNECRARITEGGACGVGDQCRAGLGCIRGACARTCANDSACRSGEFCFNGGCAPLVEDGDPCVEGRVCESGICDVPVCAACVNDSQCGSNRYCELNPGENFCRDRKAEGASCAANSQCRAGLSCRRGTCHRSCSSDGQCQSTEFCFDGGCAPKLRDGAPCVEARVCQSGICNTAACRECDSNDDCGSTSFCELFQCEPRGGVGASCGNNFECRSGLFCGANRLCQAKLGSGSVCLTNEACASGRCVFRVVPPWATCD